MELNNMLNEVLYNLIMIAGAIVIPFLIQYIRAKIEESEVVKKLTENENAQKLILDASDRVLDTVAYVNQVYVDTLKNKGEFTEEAQKEAFHRAYVEAMRLISDESREIILKLYGSVDNWLKLKIEASVNAAKKN